ncbi:hypothetical protein AMECASPLE_005434 [Ameca splendens]|uniref:Uncharacterized protein n=1 Tax=Ameca splendens TaxID=208324 RepID=A0ABV0Z7X1_9TELE
MLNMAALASNKATSKLHIKNLMKVSHLAVRRSNRACDPYMEASVLDFSPNFGDRCCISRPVSTSLPLCLHWKNNQNEGLYCCRKKKLSGWQQTAQLTVLLSSKLLSTEQPLLQNV